MSDPFGMDHTRHESRLYDRIAAWSSGYLTTFDVRVDGLSGEAGFVVTAFEHVRLTDTGLDIGCADGSPPARPTFRPGDRRGRVRRDAVPRRRKPGVGGQSERCLRTHRRAGVAPGRRVHRRGGEKARASDIPSLPPRGSPSASKGRLAVEAPRGREAWHRGERGLPAEARTGLSRGGRWKTCPPG